MIEIAPDSRMDLFRYVGIVQSIEELFAAPVDVANREGLKLFVRPSNSGKAQSALFDIRHN